MSLILHLRKSEMAESLSVGFRRIFRLDAFGVRLACEISNSVQQIF